MDDGVGVAADYARLLHSRTGLTAAPAIDAEQALDLVRAIDFKVVVLDQRMPTPGTELLKELRSISPDVYAVMLSGEASDAELGQAVGLFNEFVHKNHVATKLAPAVLHGYAMRLAALESPLDERVLLHTYRPNKFGFGKVSLFLRALSCLDAAYASPDQWSTVVELHEGQTQTFTWSATETIDLKIEEESLSKIKSQFGVPKVAGVQAKLEAEISARYRSTAGASSERSVEQTREYSLPVPDRSQAGPYVVLRRIQEAPAHLRLRAEIVKACTCCDRATVNVVEILCPTGRVVVRREDHRDDKTIEVQYFGQR